MVRIQLLFVNQLPSNSSHGLVELYPIVKLLWKIHLNLSILARDLNYLTDKLPTVYCCHTGWIQKKHSIWANFQKIVKETQQCLPQKGAWDRIREAWYMCQRPLLKARTNSLWVDRSKNVDFMIWLENIEVELFICVKCHYFSSFLLLFLHLLVLAYSWVMLRTFSIEPSRSAISVPPLIV